MQPGSHDKPNSETQGLFLISTQCLHPSTFSLSSPLPPFFSLVRRFPPLVLLLFSPFALFFSWCEMNIKATLGQLGGLQQNLIGLNGPQHAAATVLAALATTPQSTVGWGVGG